MEKTVKCNHTTWILKGPYNDPSNPNESMYLKVCARPGCNEVLE